MTLQQVIVNSREVTKMRARLAGAEQEVPGRCLPVSPPTHRSPVIDTASAEFRVHEPHATAMISKPTVFYRLHPDFAYDFVKSANKYVILMSKNDFLNLVQRILKSLSNIPCADIGKDGHITTLNRYN